MKSLAAVAAFLALGSTTLAAVSTSCPTKDICYSLNIPNATASSGDGDIFFQISAPTTYTWVALGQGTSMTGANMFVLYSSGDGKNVTVSPRQGTGHTMPKVQTISKITLLDGSGVSNGVMTANVKCSNCNSWTGGTMDFTTSSSDWLYAYKSGKALASDDQDAKISQHDDASHFSWPLLNARGGADDANPFTTITGTPLTNTTTQTTDPSAENFVPFGGDPAFGDRIARIHGALACLAFVALFPIGGILIRIASFTGVLWVHAALQGVAFAIYIVAFGMGGYLMRNLGPALTSHAHPAIGGIIFIILLSQPITGYIHHRQFVKSGRRTTSSYFHLTVGRAAIVLGIVNGGLGINLAGDVSTGGKVAYGIFAVVMLLAYIASIVVGEMRMRRRGDAPPSYNLSQNFQARRLSGGESSSGGGAVPLQEYFGRK